ncbi:TIGR02300 family protein [Camelimonas abortus]|uniref:TIGR02300 family protein n=1 Tax=Camelimonas abortus TaxID=1017184 RepID=A0ABV7LGY6_9HYPH
MAKPELGTKRVCPTTGRKFYDLNRDPIISPYTGEAFPRSMFEPQTKGARPTADEAEDDVADPATISLEEAEADVAALDVDVDVDVDVDGDSDAFLEEEEDGDDVAGLIDSDIDDEEEI